jgi:hypothetical protein
VSAGRSLDQLRVDPYALTSAPNAAFKNIANTELATNKADVGRTALIGETGVASDDEQPAGA